MSDKVADLLRQAAEALSASTAVTSTVPVTSTSQIPSVREHVRSLFAPYNSSNLRSSRDRPRNNRRQQYRQATTSETWSHKFCLLYSCNQDVVPSKQDRQELFMAGLGDKKVTFLKNRDPVIFQNKLIEIYPKLKNGGGFDLLRSDASTKSNLILMRYPPGGYTSEYLADESNLNQAVCYIRPIQQDLDPTSDENDPVILEDGLKEICLKCGKEIPVEILRKHNATCNIDNLPVLQKPKLQMKVCHYLPTDKVKISTSREVTENEEKKKCPVCTNYFHHDVIESHAAVCGMSESDEELLKDYLPETNEKQTNEKFVSDHVLQCISKTLDEMSEVENPGLIIDNYAKHFFNGVNIDQMEDENNHEEIIKFGVIVDRENIYNDMFAEIGRDEELNNPLEVTFIGEEAADYGGPRREFLTLALQGIQEKMFKDGNLLNEELLGKEMYLMNLKERKFEVAGTIAGLSILEGGPAPKMFQNFKMVLDNNEKKKENSEFLRGLEKIGLLQLCNRKPQLVKLFETGTKEHLNYGALIKLFTTQFSEEGSNDQIQEKKMFRFFLDYIKEIAAHRRGNISLEDILRFITGLEEIPLLGFPHKPSIIFTNSLSYIPTSSTCTCTLYLSRLTGLKEDVFNFFDYAFVNNYFGKV